MLLRTEDGANSAAHIQASLPRSRDLESRFPTIILSELLLECRVRKEVAHEDRVVSTKIGNSVSIDLHGIEFDHNAGGEYFRPTHPSMIMVKEIRVDQITACRFSLSACISVCACSSSVACLASKMASWPNFSSNSLSANFCTPLTWTSKVIVSFQSL